MVSVCRPRLGPPVRRGVRRAAKTAAAVAVILIVRAGLGIWVAALLVALVALVGLIAGWAAVEARTFDRHRHVTPTVRMPRVAADHAAFARALMVVAAAYLTECERQARRP